MPDVEASSGLRSGSCTSANPQFGVSLRCNWQDKRSGHAARSCRCTDRRTSRLGWPADNERGQELGRKVGENAWRRAQQFMLGTASPAAAIFAALHPPFWFHDNETAERPVRFQTEGGLAIDLPAGGQALGEASWSIPCQRARTS